ncbi:hypothetical protein Y032_0036g3204 [Ancylostoma ceylanicum]|uniref:Uncharacterized protein n=1 Tax=Ancylostoma ceylanicum TaxID=53326 RepID=A0A016UM38_9BILA|nr:hypothetical protein Y032_0036g3204 [Ancylostoma ceylanicum]
MATSHFLLLAFLVHVALAYSTDGLEFSVDTPGNSLIFKDSDVARILNNLLNSMQTEISNVMPQTMMHEPVEVVESQPSFTEVVGSEPLFTEVVEAQPSFTVDDSFPSYTEVVPSQPSISENEAIGLFDGFKRRKREAPTRAHRIKT